MCDDIFMSKPPKRNDFSKKGAASRAGKPPADKSRYIPSKDKGAKKHQPNVSAKTEERKQEARKSSAAPATSASFRGKPRSIARPASMERERSPRPPREAAPKKSKSSINADLFGMHAVREAWGNPKRYVHALFITESALEEFKPFLSVDAKRPDPTIVTKEEIDRAFPAGTVHQGIALSAQALAEISVTDIIIRAKENPRSVIVMLDQVTDPHNIGAILRSACAFGADGVVMQSKHAPEMAGVLAKTACGAVDHIPVAYETNLSRALETLKDHHYTVIGMDEHSEKNFTDLPTYERAVIVLGAEGPGMRRLIKEHCDVLVTLPTRPPIASLNVSNAAAVALYALCHG